MWSDYFFFIILTALGSLQLAALHSKLRNLQVTASLHLTRFLGLFLLFAPAVWFFGSENRNLADTNGGLDGGDQALLFAGGCLTALAITLAISHTKRLVRPIMRSRLKGLGALDSEPYIDAVVHNFKILGAKWKI